MKRRLLYFYRHQVPEFVKRAIPDSFSAYVAGKMYLYYPHPDLAFYHARYLSQAGQGQKAAKIYDPTAKNALSDPLFKCSAKAAYPDQNITARAGKFHLEFSYAGIKIIGNIKESKNSAANQVDIYLDNQLLRSERLTYRKGIANVHFSIKRSTIKLFKPESILSLQNPDGEFLVSDRLGAHVLLTVPHGDSSISEQLSLTGTLNKKGNIRVSENETRTKQQAYLALYQRANRFFKTEFNKPLMIVCGTLLGQHRNGDFILGDDDFDVGYVSEKTNPAEIKAESIQMIERLILNGFTVLINREGKPFRISDAISGLEIHLDVTPVFTRKDNHVWMHKLARLEMDIDIMRQTKTGMLCGVEVDKPVGSEIYLAANYGFNWRTPDPSFSYADWTVPAKINNGLRATCLSQSEQRNLIKLLNNQSGSKARGKFIPIGLQPLYPIAGTDAKIIK